MTTRVEIAVDEHGLGTLRVDGVDIAPGVTRVLVELRAGDRPRVRVDLVPGVLEAQLEADLEIRVPGA